MALIDVIAGGALAIVGGAGATLLQGRLHSKALIEEHEERRREIKREQAERVFEELRDLLTGYYGQLIHLIQQMAAISAGVAPDRPDMPAAPSSAKLEGIVSIYFPACQAIIGEFNKATTAIGTALMLKITEHQEAHKHEDDKSAANFIRSVHLAMATKLWENAVKMAADLREAMQPEIKKLW